MHLTYAPEADCGYLSLVDVKSRAPGKIESVPWIVDGGNNTVIADLDGAGHLVGLEIIGARKLLSPELLKTATKP